MNLQAIVFILFTPNLRTKHTKCMTPHIIGKIDSAPAKIYAACTRSGGFKGAPLHCSVTGRHANSIWSV